MVNSLITMEDIITRFSGRFVIIEYELKVIFVDKQEALALKSNRFFLWARSLHKSR